MASIDDKMEKARLRWFGQVRRRSTNAPLRINEKIDLQEYRGAKGRPKNSWNEVITYDLNFLQLTKNMARDRSLCRSMTKVVGHK